MKLEVTEALGVELVESEPLPLLQKVALSVPDALGPREGESVPVPHELREEDGEGETEGLLEGLA